MNRNRRNVTPQDVLGGDKFIQQTKKAEAKLAKKPVKDKPTLLVSTWKPDTWISFLDTMLSEFEVPCSDWSSANKYKKRALVAKLLEYGLVELGNEASIVEALMNIITTWCDEKIQFYYRQPTEFNVSYIAKAWPSYKTYVRKNPGTRMAVYSISKTLTSRMKNIIGEDNPAVWLSNPEPIVWDADGNEIQNLDQDVDDLI